MAQDISVAVIGSQQPHCLFAARPVISVTHMTEGKAKLRKEISGPDRAAAERLKSLWLSMPRDLRPTQEAIALAWGEGANQSLISQYMNGLISLNYRAVLKFAEILGLNPDDIRTDLPEQQFGGMRVREPNGGEGWSDIQGYAQAVGLGYGAEAEEYAETHRLKFRADSLRRKGLFARNLAVYYGKGDSMEPRIRDGDAILFDTSDTRPADGEIFIVQLGREIHAKRCELLDDVVYFRSDNPAGDHQWRKPKRMDNPRNPITIIGRVRWIGSWEG